MLEEKIISYTQNPYQELLSVAQRTNININELDFNLLSFSTQYRFNSDSEWNKISEKDLNLFDEDENFLKENLQLELNSKTQIFKSKQGINFCGYKINEYRLKIRDKRKKKIEEENKRAKI